MKRFLRVFIKTSLLLLACLVLYDYLHDFKLYSRMNNQHIEKTVEVIRSPLIESAETLKSSCIDMALNRSETIASRYESSETRCKPRKMLEDECLLARKRYGRPPKEHSCPQLTDKQFIYDVCRFRDTNTLNRDEWKLDCNIRICGKNVVRVGVMHQGYGLMVESTMWYVARSNADLQRIVTKIMRETSEIEHEFCIISCANKKLYIKQVLVLPPRMKRRNKNAVAADKKFNINLIVLDSVSRQHFYRQLPHTVQQLKNVTSTVYDYEMLQSLAPRTFPNMRALFSGLVDRDSDDASNTYGIASLFGKFKNMGYQTILQEDSCWYDPWGAIITENKHNMNPLFRPYDYALRWRDLQAKLRHLPVDSYGLTHLSCEVFNDYGATNQFNYPPKVCYNGYHLPKYYLNYTHKFLRSQEHLKDTYPLFFYTHLNTGHETSGRRIARTDLVLSDFVSDISALKNTLTIIFSDHGPKTTKFAQESLAGRHEIGQAMMFLIIPARVKRALGETQMHALEVNQHRLITHADLFHTLMTLHEDKQSDGLLKEVSAQRHCHDIPIYSFMSCLCDGWDERLADSHVEVHWLAEFAIGHLNNEITRLLNGSAYKNCERLVGNRFEKIRRRTDKDGNQVFTFDIVVHKYRDEEVFEVAVTVFKDRSLGACRLTRWHRISIYQHFSKCRDPEIDTELCICRKESRKMFNDAREVSRLLALPFYTVQTQSKLLDSKCLILLTRLIEYVYKSYELTNMCVDRRYNVTVNLTGDNFVSSNTLPATVMVEPWLVYYVTTVTPLAGTSIDLVKGNVTFAMLPARMMRR